eukprot:m.96263 g.96263  ORF g.96263 m.96263 type:complete len:536 (-) comp13931_c0_seq3:29-1636(-)
MLLPLALAAVLAVALGTDCSQVNRCVLVQNYTGCGWCWQTHTTEIQYGEKTGGRPGNANGPTDGGTCHDWTFVADDCHHHADCPALPNCINILGTYCGWCETTKQAMRGTSAGPLVGNCSKWVWEATSCAYENGPQHVHLAYGENTSTLTVTWASYESGEPVLHYGSDGSSMAIVKGTTKYFGPPINLRGLHYIHRATMINLKPDTSYWYNVSVGSIMSKQYFTRTPPAGTDYPLRTLVFGDMGRHGGGNILYMLTKELSLSRYHAMIHVGDFAYDLIDELGLNGDAFMSRVEVLAGRVAYMTTPGNHEVEVGQFWNYRNRFSMPRHTSRDGFDMWHSWNAQLVHFIAYSSEVFFARKDDVKIQLSWLEQDLIEANKNRAARPWIIAYGHRPMYCSNDDGDDCTKNASVVRLGLEDLFHKYGVDVVIEAHEHSYERLWPVYNYTVSQYDYVDPKAMVHIISGAAGCNEDDGVCVNGIPGPRGPWSAFRASVAGTYSYCHMTVFNATHLHFDSYAVEEQHVEDDFWVVQHNHSMRV